MYKPTKKYLPYTKLEKIVYIAKETQSKWNFTDWITASYDDEPTDQLIKRIFIWKGNFRLMRL